MRLAIFSDVHGNMEALEAVQSALALETPDRILCLGDLVGYGPDPALCIDAVLGFCDIVLAGNHDCAAAGLVATDYFNEYARQAMEWTKAVLTPKSAEKLKALPLILEEDDRVFVHAAPESPEKWEYILSPADAWYQFENTEAKVIFVGHTHIPVCFQLKSPGKIGIRTDLDLIELETGCRAIINVGSVGQPRDNNTKACYGIYDTEKATFSLKRCSYNVAAVQDKMRRASLPEYLIARLSLGQ